MTAVFYVSVLVFGLIQELKLIFHPQQALDERAAMEHYAEQKKLGSMAKLPEHATMNFIYVALCLIGLLSSQWVIFLVLVIFSLIPKPWKPLLVIDGLMGLLLILFIVINKFHLHLDLTDPIKAFLLNQFN